jgi:hypothetical protein
VTRYTCLNCDNWLSRCTCAVPRPALDDKAILPSVVSMPAWTRDAVVALLKVEADAQQALGKERVRSHLLQRGRKLQG